MAQLLCFLLVLELIIDLLLFHQLFDIGRFLDIIEFILCLAEENSLRLLCNDTMTPISRFSYPKDKNVTLILRHQLSFTLELFWVADN